MRKALHTHNKNNGTGVIHRKTFNHENVLLFLAALLTFCACSDDPEPTGQYLATIRQNELYGEKSIGEWQNDSVYPDGNMISEYMQLDADKQAKYVFQVKSRTDNGDNAVQKDGE